MSRHTSRSTTRTTLRPHTWPTSFFGPSPSLPCTSSPAPSISRRAPLALSRPPGRMSPSSRRETSRSSSPNSTRTPPSYWTTRALRRAGRSHCHHGHMAPPRSLCGPCARPSNPSTPRRTCTSGSTSSLDASRRATPRSLPTTCSTRSRMSSTPTLTWRRVPIPAGVSSCSSLPRKWGRRRRSSSRRRTHPSASSRFSEYWCEKRPRPRAFRQVRAARRRCAACQA